MGTGYEAKSECGTNVARLFCNDRKNLLSVLEASPQNLPTFYLPMVAARLQFVYNSDKNECGQIENRIFNRGICVCAHLT